MQIILRRRQSFEELSAFGYTFFPFSLYFFHFWLFSWELQGLWWATLSGNYVYLLGKPCTENKTKSIKRWRLSGSFLTTSLRAYGDNCGELYYLVKCDFLVGKEKGWAYYILLVNQLWKQIKIFLSRIYVLYNIARIASLGLVTVYLLGMKCTTETQRH